MSKLDDLCATKVMGWYESIETVDDMTLHWWGNDTLVFNRRTYDWMPSVSLDDALVCLERARNGHSLDMRYVTEAYARQWHSDKRWIVAIKTRGHPRAEAKEVTLPLAMCLCSLRAMGVPESEISIAMEE